MDPRACLERWAAARGRERRDAALDYNEWVAKGGWQVEVDLPIGGGIYHGRIVKLCETVGNAIVRTYAGTGDGRWVHRVPADAILAMICPAPA